MGPPHLFGLEQLEIGAIATQHQGLAQGGGDLFGARLVGLGDLRSRSPGSRASRLARVKPTGASTDDHHVPFLGSRAVARPDQTLLERVQRLAIAHEGDAVAC